MFKVTLVACFFWIGQALAAVAGLSPCVARDYGHGSVVCVCNSSHCDVPEPTSPQLLQDGRVRHYVSSKAGLRLEARTTRFSHTALRQSAAAAAGNTTLVQVRRGERYQSILGFGGTATDSATINTFSLSASASDMLLRTYFSEDGIGYTFMRVPIGPTDFSTHYYEYTGDHQDDIALKYFNLTVEDTVYKMPFIKRAQQLSPEGVKLFGTAWTAPQWMKEASNNTRGRRLKKEFYQTYANYYLRFLQAYAAERITFWGLTPQNEPGVAVILGNVISMAFTEEQMLQYLVENLCPSLKASGFGDLKVMLLDDNRNYLPNWIQAFKNESLRDCVSGIGLHWYSDKSTPVSVLDDVHTEYPEKFMLYTEACPSRVMGDQRVVLGKWEDGVDYISGIIQVINNWVVGFVDLNMAIDLDGGPNWLNETRDDAPVVVNATADEFYKQPTFYAIAHFSKFVPPGSVRIGLQVGTDHLEGVAFLTPDNVTAVVLHNRNDYEVQAVISDSEKGSVSLEIPANSMHTVLYK